MSDEVLPHLYIYVLRDHFLTDLSTREGVVTLTECDARLNMAAVHDAARQFLSAQPQNRRAIAEEAVRGSLHNAEKLSAPIVVTHDDSAKGRGVLITSDDRILNLHDRLKLHALRESFIRSGVAVAGRAAGVRPAPLWVRDAYFLAKDIAYVADASGRNGVDLTMNDKGDLVVDESVQNTVAKRIDDVDEMLRHMGQRSLLLRACYFEGGDLIPDFDHGRLFYGSRYQSSTYDMAVMARFVRRFEKLDYEVIPVKTDRQHYHLDIGLSPALPDGTFLASSSLGYDGGYTQDGYDALSDIVGKNRLITIDYEDAMALSANLTVVGNTLFMTACSPPLRDKLERRGFVVNAPPYNLLDPACHRRIGAKDYGGGVHCLTNEFSGGMLPAPAP